MTRPKPISDHTTASTRLRSAIETLPLAPGNEPRSDELRPGWTTIANVWLLGWCDALDRDLAIIAREIGAADAASTPEGAAEPLENAHWRLDSAREKLHAIIALAFGVPSLKFSDGTKSPPSFRVDTDATRAAVKAMTGEHQVAEKLLSHDATLKSKLDLRHKLAHSLPSIATLQSVGWIEYGVVSGGSVRGYRGLHLSTFGQIADGSSVGLIRRARRISVEGLTALVRAIDSLAALVGEAAALEPPPIVWYVAETDRKYHGRDDASRHSRKAAGLPELPPLIGS